MFDEFNLQMIGTERMEKEEKRRTREWNGKIPPVSMYFFSARKQKVLKRKLRQPVVKDCFS